MVGYRASNTAIVTRLKSSVTLALLMKMKIGGWGGGFLSLFSCYRETKGMFKSIASTAEPLVKGHGDERPFLFEYDDFV